MTKVWRFFYAGGDVAIPRLENCPKCRGQLLLETDRYGSYQQCLQCGYVHDLQIFPTFISEDTEEEKESIVSRHVSAKYSGAMLQYSEQLSEDLLNRAPTDPRISNSSLFKSTGSLRR
jgi:DNA-directed RNA polymerase subunit M/transcription elongation factor TFIIS